MHMRDKGVRGDNLCLQEGIPHDRVKIDNMPQPWH